MLSLLPAPATLSTHSSTHLSPVEVNACKPLANQRARRQQISAACMSCQVRKGKCDGQRPCRWCRDHEQPCEYEVEAGETRGRARKRRYEDLKHEHLALLELVNIAALRPDSGEILQQLKSGRKVRDLLGSLKEGDTIDDGENSHVGLGASRHTHCHRCGCDVLETRAVQWGRGVTGQGEIDDVDNTERGASRRVYPEILGPERDHV